MTTAPFDVEDLKVQDALDTIYGAVLPERVLQDVLKFGFDAIHKDQTLIDDLFYKLPKQVRDTIKQYYAEHIVTVRQNFPKDGITFPIVTVVNGADNEDTSLDYMGGFEGADFDLALVNRIQVIGHALRTDFQIFCLAGKDANAALWLYYIAKAILLINCKTLEAHGMQNVTFTGRDIQLREDLFPEFTYARIIGLSCVNYFGVRVTERVARSLEVTVFTQEPFSDTKEQMTEDS
jgi:hypothetical protein